MPDNSLPIAIKAGCRDAGVTLAALLRKSGLSLTGYYGIAKRPEHVNPESLDKLHHGLSDMIEALLVLRERVRAEQAGRGGP